VPLHLGGVTAASVDRQREAERDVGVHQIAVLEARREDVLVDGADADADAGLPTNSSPEYVSDMTRSPSGVIRYEIRRRA